MKERQEPGQGINQKDTCSKAKEKIAMNIEGHYMKSNTSPEASQEYSKDTINTRIKKSQFSFLT